MVRRVASLLAHQDGIYQMITLLSRHEIIPETAGRATEPPG
jgi:hypothetical protein